VSLWWSVVHAAELHAVALLVMLGPAARPTTATSAPPSCLEVLVDEAPAPAVEKGEAVRRAPVVAPVPGRPGRHARPRRGAPPAAAASAVASPDVGEALPVATAPAYPGGLTSSLGTSGEAVDELGAGSGGGTPGDLSAPAHLDGRRSWSCNVEGAPDETAVRVRALVRPNGTAVRVELLDQGGELPERVLEGARPCALRERYVPGLDHEGRPVERWTRPFRLVVVGVVASQLAERGPGGRR
jgi:hypothetical protein